MAQEYGAAQGIVDLARKYYDNVNKLLDLIPSKGAGSSTDSGKLPPEWEAANRKSTEQQLAGEKKPLSKRKLGGKGARPKKGAKKAQAKRKSE